MREMVANERTPSVCVSKSLGLGPSSRAGAGSFGLTNGSNDLSLHAQLVLETGGKVADATLSIASHVGDLSDLVEHVPASEHEDTNQAQGRPGVPALDNRQDIGPSLETDASASENRNDTDDPGDVIDGAFDSGVGSVREVTGKPAVNLLGLLGTVMPCQHEFREARRPSPTQK